jgi:hypothetical protein
MIMTPIIQRKKMEIHLTTMPLQVEAYGASRGNFGSLSRDAS